MKRMGYLYEKIYDIENVKLAIKNASRRKKKRRYVRRIVKNADFYAEKISKMLRDGAYVPSPNRVKRIYDTSSRKERDITIPKFYPDQIIQWAVMQIVEPVLNRGMYEYSCGSVKGRGNIYAKKYVERKLRHKDARYVLKLDLRKFFPSIRTEKLKELLARRIKDKGVLELLGVIIDSGAPGLPIGYYTSGALANFYLSEVDKFIKRQPGVKYYVRNVDDMVWMGANRRRLKRALHRLREYLVAHGYGAEVKRTWQLWRRGERPFDFVGYHYRRGRDTSLTKRNYIKLLRAVRSIADKGLNIARARRLISYLGMSSKICFKAVYLQAVKPVVSHRVLTGYVKDYERRTAYAA